MRSLRVAHFLFSYTNGDGSINCPNCGSTIPDGSDECLKCKKIVTADNGAIEQENSIDASSDTATGQGANFKSIKKSKIKNLIILAILIALTIVTVNLGHNHQYQSGYLNFLFLNGVPEYHGFTKNTAYDEVINCLLENNVIFLPETSNISGKYIAASDSISICGYIPEYTYIYFDDSTDKIENITFFYSDPDGLKYSEIASYIIDTYGDDYREVRDGLEWFQSNIIATGGYKSIEINYDGNDFEGYWTSVHFSFSR